MNRTTGRGGMAARARVALLAALAICAMIGASHAHQVDLDDPATISRIKNLEAELRCLVCQAQSIAESDSDFAQDIRREIDRMVAEGGSDQDIKDFLVERYGEFILYRPPLQSTTLLLWAGPGILLLVGAGALGVVLARRRRAGGAAGLTAEDRQRAEALLAAMEGKGKTTQ